MNRALKAEGMRQWCEAVTEAQKRRRPYSWHECYGRRFDDDSSALLDRRALAAAPRRFTGEPVTGFGALPGVIGSSDDAAARAAADRSAECRP